MVMAPSMAITISHPPPLYTQRGGAACRGAPCVLFQENVLLKPWLYGAIGLTIDQIHTQICKNNVCHSQKTRQPLVLTPLCQRDCHVIVC